MTVQVVPYSGEWPQWFETAKTHLVQALTSVAVDGIEHVGSTAVPGLPAKPVLDIDVVVQPEEVVAAVLGLERAGYVHLGDLGMPGREAFESPNERPARNVYVVVAGGLQMRAHLAVRDALRSSEQLRTRYGETKLHLATDPEMTAAHYTAGKSAILQEVLRAAGVTPDERRTLARANALVPLPQQAERPTGEQAATGGSREPHLLTRDDEVTAFALHAAVVLGYLVTSAQVLRGGAENHAVRLTRENEGDIVVRFRRTHDPRDADPFDVESWCGPAAATAGIDTPDFLQRTSVDGASVIVHRFVSGTPVEADDLVAWKTIGQMASRLHSVSTAGAPVSLFSRFGRDLDAAWAAHLAYNLAALSDDDPLIALGAYSPADVLDLIHALRRLQARSLDQGLVHGDLSTRNVLRHDHGYLLLDWGTAHVGPTPWTDLRRIHQWHDSRDEQTTVSSAAWQAVLEGAGYSTGSADPIVSELSILHALDVLRWALDQRPDRLDEFLTPTRLTLQLELTRLRTMS